MSEYLSLFQNRWESIPWEVLFMFKTKIFGVIYCTKGLWITCGQQLKRIFPFRTRNGGFCCQNISIRHFRRGLFWPFRVKWRITLIRFWMVLCVFFMPMIRGENSTNSSLLSTVLSVHSAACYSGNPAVTISRLLRIL